MKRLLHKNILSYFSSIGGLASISGAHNVCHTACVGVIALLSVMGISVSGMPLMWLQKYNLWFWLMGIVFFVPMLYIYYKHKWCMSVKPLLVNGGLLVAGIPFKAFQQYSVWLWIIGGVLVSTSIVLFTKDKLMKNMKSSKKKQNKGIWDIMIISSLVFLLVLFAFNFYLLGQVRMFQNVQHSSQKDMSMMGQSMSRMSFSEFDNVEARKLMDKDGDGKCDSCGMDIDQCIVSGMMQCSMDPGSKIGILGSQHVHADWKIYIDKKLLDLSFYSHMQRMQDKKSVSSFIHVDSGAVPPEKTGDLLHMHATGVSLSMFFESLDMNFSQDCLEISGEKYCVDINNSLKFYVNGKPNDLYDNYIFNDLDKILISYGPKNEDVSAQLDSITNFAGKH